MKKILLTALSLIAMTTASAGIAGTYTVEKAAGVETANWKFAGGEAWTAEADPEDPWYVVIDATETAYEIYDILGWGETIPCTYDEASATITIAAGELCYTDEDGYKYYVCGGISGYNTAQGFMDYCDANWSYLAGTRELKNVEFKVEDNTITATTPIVMYIDYGYEGYWGCAYSITTEMVLKADDSGIQTVETENVNAPVEYFNIQGVRVANPAAGQLLIKRQGNKATKIIVR